MVEGSEISELSEVYGEMDGDGKNEMVRMARNLLNAQITGEDPLGGERRPGLDAKGGEAPA